MRNKMKPLLALAGIVLAVPAYADCQRSPFTGMVWCSDDPVPSFANEEVKSYPSQRRPRPTVCESERTPFGYTTTCREE